MMGHSREPVKDHRWSPGHDEAPGVRRTPGAPDLTMALRMVLSGVRSSWAMSLTMTLRCCSVRARCAESSLNAAVSRRSRRAGRPTPGAGVRRSPGPPWSRLSAGEQMDAGHDGDEGRRRGDVGRDSLSLNFDRTTTGRRLSDDTPRTGDDAGGSPGTAKGGRRQNAGARPVCHGVTLRLGGLRNIRRPARGSRGRRRACPCRTRGSS